MNSDLAQINCTVCTRMNEEKEGAKAVSVVEGLPELPEPSKLLAGPTETCNWVIPGRVMAGAYPGNQHEPLHSQHIESIISAGNISQHRGH